MLVGLVPYIDATYLAALAGLTGAGPRRARVAAQVGGDAGPGITVTLIRLQVPHGGHRWQVRCPCGAMRWRLYVAGGAHVGCRGCLMGTGLSYASWAFSGRSFLRNVWRPLRRERWSASPR